MLAGARGRKDFRTGARVVMLIDGMARMDFFALGTLDGAIWTSCGMMDRVLAVDDGGAAAVGTDV